MVHTIERFVFISDQQRETIRYRAAPNDDIVFDRMPAKDNSTRAFRERISFTHLTAITDIILLSLPLLNDE